MTNMPESSALLLCGFRLFPQSTCCRILISSSTASFSHRKSFKFLSRQKSCSSRYPYSVNRDIGATDPEPVTKAQSYVVSCRNVCRLFVMPFPWKPNSKIISVTCIPEIGTNKTYCQSISECHPLPLEYYYIMFNLPGYLPRILRISSLHIQ